MIMSSSTPDTSPKIPYHPYTNSCLVCGANSLEYDNELVRKELNRCSGCKQAVYCSKMCQKNDWKVHKKECNLLQDENVTARALSKTDENFASVTNGQSLRQFLLKNSLNPQISPLLFVIKELKSFLELSLSHWSHLASEDTHPALLRGRMNHLINTIQKFGNGGVNWLSLSSALFGTCMIINVVNKRGKEYGEEGEYLFNCNAWFQAFVYNHGEILDRIKLFSILQQHDFDHLLPDTEFPLLQMKEPKLIGGQFYFPHGHVLIEKFGKNCMICKKIVETRAKGQELPRP